MYLFPVLVLDKVPNTSIATLANGSFMTAATFYVDAKKGSDSNSSTIGDPLKTIPKAVVAAKRSDLSATIILRSGTFYLTVTIMLNDKDSELTIQNYPGEDVIVSGGKVVILTWEAVNTENSMNIYKPDLSLQGIDSMTGFRVNGQSRDSRICILSEGK